MKEWIAKRVTELLGIEEEVLISMIHNHLIDQVRGGWSQGWWCWAAERSQPVC
jgi:hypothetical protein